MQRGFRVPERQKPVGNRFTILKSNQRTVFPVRSPLKGVFIETLFRTPVPFSRKEASMEADQAACRNREFPDASFRHLKCSSLQFALLRSGEHTDNSSGEITRDINIRISRLELPCLISILLINNFRFTDRKLVAFTPHRLDNGKMKFSAAADMKRIRAVVSATRRGHPY